MAKKETLSQFLKNFKTFDKQIQRLALKDWDQSTLEAMGIAAQKTPLAGGDLQGSIKSIRAKVTRNGIESALFSALPYAKWIELGREVRHGKLVRLKHLKNSGEVSYYIWGGGHAGKQKGVRRGAKIMKQRKGTTGYMSKTVTQVAPMFVDGLSAVISKVWRKL